LPIVKDLDGTDALISGRAINRYDAKTDADDLDVNPRVGNGVGCDGES